MSLNPRINIFVDDTSESGRFRCYVKEPDGEVRDITTKLTKHEAVVIISVLGKDHYTGKTLSSVAR